MQTAYINDIMKMIFNNKTHTVITASYQTNTQNFCELQHLNVFIVHLITTLSFSMYVWFQLMYRSIKNQKMLCTCSQCLNIQYEIQILKNIIMKKVFIQITVQKILQNQLDQFYSWMFIYSWFKEITYHLTNKLNTLIKKLRLTMQYHKNLLMNQHN